MAETKLYLNIQEQVEKNKNDIKFMLEEEGTLNKFGIKVIGQEDGVSDMPSVADYKEEHEDWAYGDAYAIGTEAPYTLYVLTRANGTHPNDYWFNIGQFPVPGPQGETGEQGPAGHTPQVTVATPVTSTLPAGSSAFASVMNVGTADDPQLAFTFGIPKGDKGDTGEPGRPGAFHINGQVANASLLPDASLVDPTAAYAVGTVLPYDVYVIMTIDNVQSWLNLGPVLTEISDTYELNISGTSGSLTQEQVDALVNDTNMNFIKIGDYFFIKSNKQGTLIEYVYIFSGKYIRTFLVNVVNNTFSYGTPIEVVDTASAQTITGVKTFDNGIKTGKIEQKTGSSYIQLGESSGGAVTVGGNQIQINKPLIQNLATGDLGSETKPFRNGHFSGQVYAENTFNVINASDISVENNVWTLSDTQFALITNGKPTLIKGTLFNNNNNCLFHPSYERGESIFLFGFCERLGLTCDILVSINQTTKVISFSTARFYNIGSLYAINGKVLPNYPSNTGTFVLKCVDGTLTWVAE
jgi:hypothetical protein